MGQFRQVKLEMNNVCMYVLYQYKCAFLFIQLFAYSPTNSGNVVLMHVKESVCVYILKDVR